MSERLYYIPEAITQNKWVTYNEAHNYGYTRNATYNIMCYTSNVEGVELRYDNQANKLFDFRLSLPHSWVTDIDELDLYIQIGMTSLYHGESATDLPGWSSSLYSEEITHATVNSHIYSFEELYDLGYTQYPCSNYYMLDGIPLVWYDSAEGKYYDNRDGKKEWVDEPPVISNFTPQDTWIQTNDTLLNSVPQWEDDLSQIPLKYRVSSFDEQDSYFSTHINQLSGYNNVDHVLYQSSIVQLYQDVTRTSTSLYVLPEEGVYDYGGTFHPQGDSFIGDYKVVYIDSDSDVIFYNGSTPYTFGQTHDDLNPVIYYNTVDKKYYTLSGLLLEGYTQTPSTELLVSDTNDEQHIYSNNIHSALYNSVNGYYINNNWYDSIRSLNAAGYYLVEKDSMTINRDKSAGSSPYDYNITNQSSSFNTSHKKAYYLDADNREPFKWDGNYWFVDVELSPTLKDISLYKTNLSDMPSTTTSNPNYWKFLLVLITASGDPITQFSSRELGTQIYLYIATNYYSSLSDTDKYKSIVISRYKLV